MKILFALLVSFIGTVPFLGCGRGGEDRANALSEARARAQEARAAAATAREVQRLAELWTYSDVAADKGRQVAAAIRSTNDVDTDGQGARSLQLVFRDHPSWGRSSYLVLQAGDFNCYGRCTVTVTVDGVPTRMAARRPPTDEAIAMFINDAPALWRLTTGAKQLAVEFPVKAGGTRTATFDVAGLVRSKMPGWDALSR